MALVSTKDVFSGGNLTFVCGPCVPAAHGPHFHCPDLNFGGFILVPCDRNSKEKLLACLFSLLECA